MVTLWKQSFMTSIKKVVLVETTSCAIIVVLRLKHKVTDHIKNKRLISGLTLIIAREGGKREKDLQPLAIAIWSIQAQLITFSDFRDGIMHTNLASTRKPQGRTAAWTFHYPQNNE